MREMSGGSHSEELRAIAGVVATDPFGIEDGIRGVLSLQEDRPEWSFLRQERKWQTLNQAQAAVVGNFSGLAIVNRESRSLVVVTGFQSTSGAATDKTFRIGLLPDPNFEVGVNSEIPITGMIDTRYIRGLAVFGNAAARHALVDYSAAEVTALNPVLYGNLPSGIMPAPYPPKEFGPLAILRPNSYFIVLNAIVNLGISGIIFGYEKPLYQGVRA